MPSRVEFTDVGAAIEEAHHLKGLWGSQQVVVQLMLGGVCVRRECDAKSAEVMYTTRSRMNDKWVHRPAKLTLARHHRAAV